jgi:hypothetical protein
MSHVKIQQIMRHILSSAFFFVTIGSFAQNPATVTIINNTDVAYPGFQYEYYTDTTTNNFSPGAGGTGWVTDFTPLNMDETETISITDISQTSLAAAYPMADLVLSNSSGMLAVAANSANAFSIVDEINPAFQGTINFHYTQPDTVLRYSLSYLDEWSDNSSYFMAMYFGGDPGNGTFADSMRFTSVRQDYTIVDGEGTCITESGSYTTLRLQTTTLLTDYVEFYQNGTWVSFGQMGQSSTMTYTWWAKNSGLWVAMCEIDLTTGEILNVSRLASMITTTGIAEQGNTSTVKLYPNPASDVITIEDPSGEGQLEFTDMTGRVVKSVPLNATVTTISIADLPAGMYTYRVTGTNQQGKLQVAR